LAQYEKGRLSVTICIISVVVVVVVLIAASPAATRDLIVGVDGFLSLTDTVSVSESSRMTNHLMGN